MRVYAPILAVVAAIAFAPVSGDTAPVHRAGSRVLAAGPKRSRGQGGIIGRYVLRSVDGVNLPAPVTGEDARHKIQVMDGVLILSSNGTYVCQTIAQTTYMGLVQLEADSLHGQYAVIGGGAITFGIPPKEVDTVATTGDQIAWTHPTRRGIGVAKFVYSK
jgi:hypothetical protein